MRYSVYETINGNKMEIAQFLLEHDAEKFVNAMTKIFDSLSVKYEIKDNYEQKAE